MTTSPTSSTGARPNGRRRRPRQHAAPTGNRTPRSPERTTDRATDRSTDRATDRAPQQSAPALDLPVQVTPEFTGTFADLGVPASIIFVALDMLYAGQTHTLPVVLPTGSGATLTRERDPHRFRSELRRRLRPRARRHRHPRDEPALRAHRRAAQVRPGRARAGRRRQHRAAGHATRVPPGALARGARYARLALPVGARSKGRRSWSRPTPPCGSNPVSLPRSTPSATCS